jgi:nicotinamide N-methyltransferase
MMSQERREECKIVAQGYLWGADVGELLEQLVEEQKGIVKEVGRKFDLLILGDLLFNHSEHTKLLSTVRRTLARTADARALVFFTPYRPWLFEKDMAFFAQAKRVGSTDEVATMKDTEELSEQQQKEEARLAGDGFGPMKVEKVLEHVMEEVMFKEDRGDELLRRTVSTGCVCVEILVLMRWQVFGYELMWADLQDGA